MREHSRQVWSGVSPARSNSQRPGHRAPSIGPALDATLRHALAADVRARLGPVCAWMPPEQFARLVDDVVAFKLRWAHEEQPREPA